MPRGEAEINDQNTPGSWRIPPWGSEERRPCTPSWGQRRSHPHCRSAGWGMLMGGAPGRMHGWGDPRSLWLLSRGKPPALCRWVPGMAEEEGEGLLRRRSDSSQVSELATATGCPCPPSSQSLLPASTHTSCSPASHFPAPSLLTCQRPTLCLYAAPPFCAFGVRSYHRLCHTPHE